MKKKILSAILCGVMSLSLLAGCGSSSSSSSGSSSSGGSITDIKRADRAKGLLMKFKNMSEEEAHRYLEKTALDRRVSRRQIADEIIDFYEED